MNGKKVIKVLIADDHALFREGLRRILGSEKDIKVVGEASDSSQVMELVGKLRPDVILMDISLPGPDGIKVTRQIKKRYGKVHVIMLSMYEDTAHITDSFQVGASAYVIKSRPSGELVQTIRSVVKEGVSIPSLIEHKLLKGLREGAGSRIGASQELTKTEIKIVKFIAEGKTNKEIARKLYVSEKTVKNHLNHIYRKLAVKNRTQAVMEALKRGYISRG